jgi:hypothetical protein
MQIYSAASAPVLWGAAFFVVPHLLMGGAALYATASRKQWFRGLKGGIGLAVQGVLGAAFFGVAAYSVANNTVQTISCRAASGSMELQRTTGPVHIVQDFYKPGYGYVRFTVGDQLFVTATAGLGNDCGYLKPLGSAILKLEGTTVHVEYRGSAVLSLSTDP